MFKPVSRRTRLKKKEFSSSFPNFGGDMGEDYPWFGFLTRKVRVGVKLTRPKDRTLNKSRIYWGCNFHCADLYQRKCWPVRSVPADPAQTQAPQNNNVRSSLGMYIYIKLFVKKIFIQNKTRLLFQNSEGKSGKKGILDLEARKRTTAVATLKSMFAQLEKAFSKNHQISEVAILLGGTVVSPKETFLVTFPSAVYDGRVLTVPEAKTRLMRQLVTHPCWAEIPELKPTKMHVFIHASRDDELSQLGLRPRTSFKKPTTGRVFRLNFMCQCSVVSSELSQLEESDFELSGVEPLEV